MKYFDLRQNRNSDYRHSGDGWSMERFGPGFGGKSKSKCHATHSDGDNWNSLFEHLGSQKPLEVASSSFDFCHSWPMVHRYFRHCLDMCRH